MVEFFVWCEQKKEVRIFSLLMSNNYYKDILSQHPIGPEELVLSRHNLTLKDIAPDYISF